MFRAHSCVSTYQYFIPFYSWINVPLCEYTFVYLSLVDGHVGWFTVLDTCMQVFGKHVSLLWLQRISTRELLATLNDNPVFQREGITLHSPQQCVRVPVLDILTKVCHCLSFWLKPIYWYLRGDFDLEVKDAEHLFICFLAICVSSLEKRLFKSSANFKMRLSFYCWVLKQALIRCMICKYFLRFYGLFFPFLFGVLWNKKDLNFD